MRSRATPSQKLALLLRMAMGETAPLGPVSDRARAEALGVECKVGIADRAVRVVVLSAGLVFGDLKAIEPAVYLLAAMAVITVFQRIFHVRSELTKPVTDAA